jgi:hypothetical protein
MVVMRMIILFVIFGLTGCAVATGSRITAPISLPDHASLSGSSVVGAGSFPQSILIPGTDTSIRIGG